MRHCLAAALATALAAASLPAQDLMYYRFDANCGSEVINYATGSTVGAGSIGSTLTGAPATSWTNGAFGTALSGVPTASFHNQLNTGWNPGTYTGSLSISFWIRNHPGNPNAIGFGYLFGVLGPNFRCFTGSSGKLFFAGWGGSNLVNVTDLTPLLNAGWVHCAVTLDTTTNQGIWYINGVADPAVTLTTGVNFTGSNFAIGARDTSGSSPSPLDTDDFLFTTRVLTPAEVLALSQAAYAGGGAYGSTCGPVLDDNGQRPSVGNATFGLDVAASGTGLCSLMFGFDRCTLGGVVPLPLDLGTLSPLLAGCNAYLDPSVATLSVVLVNGQATLPFPLPPLPSLYGKTLYAQALTFDATTGGLRASNGFGIGLGL